MYNPAPRSWWDADLWQQQDPDPWDADPYWELVLAEADPANAACECKHCGANLSLKKQLVEQLCPRNFCTHCHNLVQRSTKTLTLKAATPSAKSLIVKLRRKPAK